MLRHKAYLFIAVLLLLVSWQIKAELPIENNFFSIVKEIDRISLYKGTQARELVDELYRISHDFPDNSELYTWALHKEVFLNNIQGKIDTSLIDKVNTQLALTEKDEPLFEKALLQYTLAIAHSNIGNFADAFGSALQALELFKTLKNNDFIVKTLIALGNICALIKSDKMAEEYFHQSLGYLSKDDIAYHSILQNIYMIWSHTEQRRAEAIHSLEALIPVFEAYPDTGLMTVATLNVGVCYQANKQYEKAYKYFKKAAGIIKDVDNKKLQFALSQNLGNYYFAVKDYENTYLYYQQAREIAEEEQNIELCSHLYSRLSNYYSTLGESDSAYKYLKEHQILNNQLINSAKPMEAYRNYISVFLESAEDKLKIAEQEIIIRNRRFIVALLSTAGAVIIVVFLLVFIRQKKQQMFLLRENLDLKIREITSYSLLLSDKNNVLKQISQITTAPNVSGREFSAVNGIIEKNMNVEKDWENFMLHFNQVHPGFFDKLKIYCDSLTGNNLKLCAYFRIGISTKEVAQILNLSPDTIKVNRYRIKKKFGLAEDQNLDEFLQSI